MKNHVEFLDVHEFLGLLERCNPSKEEEKTVSRWATMLLENGRKTFGALRTEVLDARLDKLAQHHPNFAEVIGWIEAELAFAKVAGHGLDFQRLLLVGPPGTGKTTFGLELADVLGVPSEVVAMNQRQAGSFLTGTEQHWANTQPGAVFRLLARSQVINPIMVLDEIEKAAKDPRWDPLAGPVHAIGTPHGKAVCRCGAARRSPERLAHELDCDRQLDRRPQLGPAVALQHVRDPSADGRRNDRARPAHVRAPD
jgi:ATP-dependent Lon protease